MGKDEEEKKTYIINTLGHVLDVDVKHLDSEVLEYQPFSWKPFIQEWELKWELKFDLNPDPEVYKLLTGWSKEEEYRQRLHAIDLAAKANCGVLAMIDEYETCYYMDPRVPVDHVREIYGTITHEKRSND